MATKHTTPRRVGWATLTPTVSPFAAYGIIMLLVAIFGER